MGENIRLPKVSFHNLFLFNVAFGFSFFMFFSYTLPFPNWWTAWWNSSSRLHLMFLRCNTVHFSDRFASPECQIFEEQKQLTQMSYRGSQVKSLFATGQYNHAGLRCLRSQVALRNSDTFHYVVISSLCFQPALTVLLVSYLKFPE